MAENAPFYSKICEGFAGTSLFKITTSFPLLTSSRPFLQTRISPNNTSHFANLFSSIDRSNRSPWGEHTKENEYISDGNDLVSLHNDFFLTLESQIHSFRNIFFEINPSILSVYSMDYMYSQNPALNERRITSTLDCLANHAQYNPYGSSPEPGLYCTKKYRIRKEKKWDITAIQSLLFYVLIRCVR